MNAPLFNISARKVGGIRFLKIGRINVSLSVSRPAIVPAPVTPDRITVRPVLHTTNGQTLAGLRAYRNGRLHKIVWEPIGFDCPAEAMAHANAAQVRSGFALQR